jgi:acetyl-CoA carboxylase biotin carboxyl carrier protein
MRIDQPLIKQLSTWISQRGIDLLELTTPEASLSLQRDAPAPAAADPVQESRHHELTAPSPGRYLDRHPLSAQPLVMSGASVEAGQLVGFLQIGTLLLPLRSPQAGRIVSLPRNPGDTLGYGSVVMCLVTEARS